MTTRTRTVNPATAEITEPAAPQTAEGRTVRPFVAFLQEHQHGELHDELSLALNELVLRVQALRKAGVLTLKVEVKPAGRSHNQVFVAGKVTLKLPEGDVSQSIFFVDDAGNLTRANPDQLELPALRRVDGAPALAPLADDASLARHTQHA